MKTTAKRSALQIATVIGIGISFMFMGGCAKDEGPIVISPPVDTTQPPVLMSFANDIQPIFTSSCVGVDCHNETHEFLDLRDCCSYNQLWFDGANAPYVDTINPEGSFLYTQIATGGVMNEHLSSFEVKRILQWIEEGAKNN